MTVKEAKKRIGNIIYNYPRTVEETFEINELLKFVFDHEKKPEYAVLLASQFCNMDKCDIELYYDELAIQYGHLSSCFHAGNIYHDGLASCGKNLKKAFEYYKLASNTKAEGDGSLGKERTDWHNDAKLRLAAMYKNGEYVEKNDNEYKRLVNEVYEEIIDEDYEFDTYDALKEKAKLSIEEGNNELAYECLTKSINNQLFYFEESGMIEEIEGLEETVEMLYKLIEFDAMDINFYDLFYLLKRKCKIGFSYNNKEHIIETLEYKGSLVIKLDRKWYRDVLEMISKAILKEDRLKNAIMFIDDWEVLEWEN